MVRSFQNMCSTKSPEEFREKFQPGTLFDICTILDVRRLPKKGDASSG